MYEGWYHVYLGDYQSKEKKRQEKKRKGKKTIACV